MYSFVLFINDLFLKIPYMVAEVAGVYVLLPKYQRIYSLMAFSKKFLKNLI